MDIGDAAGTATSVDLGKVARPVGDGYGHVAGHDEVEKGEGKVHSFSRSPMVNCTLGRMLSRRGIGVVWTGR